MIRRLRIRLVAVSMLSLFIVLTVIMGTMAVVSWQNLTDNADFTLSILEDNGGVFPKSEDFILEGRVPGKPDKIRQFSPELPYETRYFTVQLNEEARPPAPNIRTSSFIPKAREMFCQIIFRVCLPARMAVATLEG